jgi:hypothetical protein
MWLMELCDAFNSFESHDEQKQDHEEVGPHDWREIMKKLEDTFEIHYFNHLAM